MNPINLPPSLRWGFRGRVIEVLIIGLEESIINLVEFVVENLLRKLVTVRRSVRSKQNPVLILVEESPRSPRLPPQLANTRSDVNVHVRKAVEAFGYIGKIFREIPHMQ